jgi:hypothetical protein
MGTARFRFVGKGLAALACLIGGAAIGQGVQLAMLDRLSPGLWEIRMRDGGQSERLCLEDGRRLIQLRHPNLACRQFVVEDGPGSVTVHYTCPGQGTGRTHLRFETPRLVQIESAGVASRLPFDIVAEARRVGDCGKS